MKKTYLLAMLTTFFSGAALAQPMTPLQHYLYNESGYAPPPVAAVTPTDRGVQTQYYAAYEPPPLDPDYTDGGSEENSGEALRHMLIAVGN